MNTHTLYTSVRLLSLVGRGATTWHSARTRPLLVERAFERASVCVGPLRESICPSPGSHGARRRLSSFGERSLRPLRRCSRWARSRRARSPGWRRLGAGDGLEEARTWLHQGLEVCRNPSRANLRAPQTRVFFFPSFLFSFFSFFLFFLFLFFYFREFPINK